MIISRRKWLRQIGAGAAGSAALPSLLRAGAPAAAGKTIADEITQRGPLRLHRNENAYGPSPNVTRVLREASAEVTTRYPDALEQRLRERLAALHAVTPEQVVLGCGSGEILRMSASAFLGARKKIVLARPTFESMAHYASQAGAEVVPVPLRGDHAHDLDAMLLQADAETGLVYVCNPNNPTGSLTNRRDVESFVARLPRTAHVIIDEAYHHYVGASPEYASFLDHPLADDRIIVTRSFSAMYGLAGVRIGYGVAATGAAQRLAEARVGDDVGGVAALAAIAALEDDGHVARSARQNMDERQEFWNQANARMLRTIDSHANFVMLNTGRPAQAMVDHFRTNAVLVGGPFAGFEKHVRVSLGRPEDMREFWRVWDLLPASHNMVM